MRTCDPILAISTSRHTLAYGTCCACTAVVITPSAPLILLCALCACMQIDNPYLDTATNGLTYAAERMKGLALHGHVRLKATVRSNLAAAAAELL